MTEETSIEVQRGGSVLMRGVSSCSLNGERLSKEASTTALHDLMDEAAVLAHFSLLCNCDNVSPVRVFTPSDKLMRAAEKRGNIPPDDYYVLDCFLGEHQERNEDHGGTHASPKFHVRRGHIRRLADGRRTWVKQCSVGDITNGRVFKDYNVMDRPQEARA